MSRPHVDAVVLSQGTKPAALARCLESLLTQTGVEMTVLCVGNGWEPTGLPDGVRTLHLPENVGAPQGRNLGAAQGDAPLVFFLDDDAWLPTTDAVAALAAQVAEGTGVGMAQPRIVDPDTGVTERRWVPRLSARSPGRSSDAFTVAEGACLVRREAFEAAGGWAGRFFYGHEGIELTWRVWDQGLAVRYVADVVAAHPSGPAFRRDHQMYLNGRNRVWLARRNLPAPLVRVYLASWWLISRVRLRADPPAWAQWRKGWHDGWSTPFGERRPLRWRTVLRLTVRGRPPIV